mgnify:CR=1 FL=1
MDIHTILNKLPHRYPFLMVDRVLEVEKNVRIRALKNVNQLVMSYPIGVRKSAETQHLWHLGGSGIAGKFGERLTGWFVRRAKRSHGRGQHAISFSPEGSGQLRVSIEAVLATAFCFDELIWHP